MDVASRATNCRCIQCYGIVSNPLHPPWRQCMTALANTPAWLYFSCPGTLTFHNLCTTLSPPPGLISLLGLSHKFCIERTWPTTDLRWSHSHFKWAICLRHWLDENQSHDNTDTSNSEYLRKLYVPSTWDPPRAEHGNIKLAIMKFFDQIDFAATEQASLPSHSNLTPMQHRLLQELKANTQFIVCLSDKNLSPCIIECRHYIEWVHHNHLSNTSTYQCLTKEEATNTINVTIVELKWLIKDHKKDLSQAEQTYFECSYKLAHHLLQCYITWKCINHAGPHDWSWAALEALMRSSQNGLTIKWSAFFHSHVPTFETPTKSSKNSQH